MTALYITLIILAVLMLILLIPIDCVIDFSYNDGENRGYIVIKYFFVKFKILPTEKEFEKAAEETDEEAKKEVPPKDKKDIAGLVKFGKTVYTELKNDIFNLINHFFRHTIRIKELNISSNFGTGDPMYTGIISGAVNAVVYNTVSLIDRHMQLDKWNVALNADFDNACIAAGVYCKLRTRCLYVIKIGIMAAVLLFKIQKINRRIKKNG